MAFPSHAAIITAAGSSERFQTSPNHLRRKKEFILLDDRTVLYHAVEPFLSVPGLQAIFVTHPIGLHDETEVALDNLMFASKIPIYLVEGGQSRQESVLKALELLESSALQVSYVAIHDGARPWLTSSLIINTLATATVFGGAVPVLVVHDALKRIDEHQCLSKHLERNNIVTVQTPQIFSYPKILEAHRHAIINTQKAYVDDTEIFSDYGGMVGTVEGMIENRKITTPSDMEVTVVRHRET